MWEKSFTLAIVLCCSSCFAQEITSIGLAKSDFNYSVANVNKIEARCEESEVVLEQKDFRGIGADKEQIKAAVIYYYFKAKAACTGEAVKNYLLASAVLSSLDKENSDLYSESDKLIASTNTQLIKTQPAYEALPDLLKERLSTLDVLGTPFNLLKSVEALGLE